MDQDLWVVVLGEKKKGRNHNEKMSKYEQLKLKNSYKVKNVTEIKREHYL